MEIYKFPGRREDWAGKAGASSQLERVNMNIFYLNKVAPLIILII